MRLTSLIMFLMMLMTMMMKIRLQGRNINFCAYNTTCLISCSCNRIRNWPFSRYYIDHGGSLRNVILVLLTYRAHRRALAVFHFFLRQRSRTSMFKIPFKRSQQIGMSLFQIDLQNFNSRKHSMKSQHQSQSQHTNVISIGDNEMANVEQNYDGRSFDNSSHETFTEIDMMPA